MKLKGFLAAVLLLHMTVANALIVSVNGYGEVPEEGLNITITEAEEDIMTGDMLMTLQGNLLASSNALTVTITRSAEGLKDEFCCAGQCTGGNEALEQVLNFTPDGAVNWYSHYAPVMPSRAKVRYLFDDGAETRTLTVQYAYGVAPIPTSFPKKHLIEEFTGQDCGYCPYGMDCVHDFMAKDPNWILIMHHYGYQADHFSVNGSKTITNSLSVSGAPSIAINRAKTKSEGGNSIVFHPGYLPSVSKSQFDTETYASINIENAYDAETRTLNVTVSGIVCEGEHPALNLTVLVKESGMIDYQADYYDTYEGWAEFRHTNAVRLFLSAAKGDAITIDENERTYTATYTGTIKEAWVPENCMVVAFLTESFKPLVQVEERPVVEGTEGGSNIEHGGITPVEVPDYYPEYNATDGPEALTGKKSETMITNNAYYEDYNDKVVCTIQAYNKTSKTYIGGSNYIPFSFVYVFLPRGTKKLHIGTYEFNDSQAVNSAYAGFRDDATMTIDGSMFYLTSLTYLNQGYLVPYAQWLIADGTLTITKERWSVDGHARNGAEIHFSGEGVITNGGYENDEEGVEQVMVENAAQKSLEDGRLIIRRGDKVYTVTGAEVQ